MKSLLNRFSKLWLIVSTYPIKKYWEHFINTNKVPTEKDVLQYAAYLIKVKGWTRLVYEDNAGRFCTLGAIKRATFTLQPLTIRYQGDLYEKAVKCTAKYIDKKSDLEPRVLIPHWNDNVVDLDGNGKRQVINTLLKAAKGC